MTLLKGIERRAKRFVPQRWRKHLRASKYQLIMERSAPVDLIVHVGAHWGEDATLYESFGAQTVLWIEADPDTYAVLEAEIAKRTGITRHLATCALVSARAADMPFHRFSGDGASSSVHQATDIFKQRFQHTCETGEVLTLRSRSLPEILANHGIAVSEFKRAMLVVDVQGHELSVLKGLGESLEAFHLCKCEVSRVPMYEGGAAFKDVDTHFRQHGFKLVSHRYALVQRHGDVLYMRD
jgi:FkbM family methyltransferase